MISSCVMIQQLGMSKNQQESSVHSEQNTGVLELSLNELDESTGPEPISRSFYDQSIRVDDMNEKAIGIRRSSYNMEQDEEDNFRDHGELEQSGTSSSLDHRSEKNRLSQDSQSFSALNESTKDPMFKSKLSRRSDDYRVEEETGGKFDFNMSIYTDRRGTPKYEEQQPSSVYKSVYMSKDFQNEEEETLTAKEEEKSEPSNKESSASTEFREQEKRSTTYFLEGRGCSIEVSKDSLKDVYDQFFEKEIFVPLFKYQRYDEWVGSKCNRYDPESECHRMFKTPLERYVRYLNENHLEQFYAVLKAVQEIRQGAYRRKKEKSEGNSFFKLDFGGIIDTIKNIMSSTKGQSLRKSLLARIRSINTMIEYCEEGGGSGDELIAMKETVDGAWRELGEVELLLNFEETEEYCTKKIESSPEAKFKQIWMKYREYARNEKRKLMQSDLSYITL